MPDAPDRVLFRRASPGAPLVRGELVRRIQLALARAGADVGVVDGIFGADTARALQEWRQRVGAAGGDEVCVEDWTALTHTPPPSLFERCLQLTSCFEGHGFGRAAGNFDGAGVTWGVIGFQLKSGSLQAVLQEIDRRDRAGMVQALGRTRHKELMKAAGKRWPKSQAWADSVSVPPRNTRLRDDWSDAFARLGALDAAIEVQREHAEERYWTLGLRDAERLSLSSELGHALTFDIAVQNGGVSAGELHSIERRIEQSGATAETERRVIIADVVAEHSNPRWIADVRARKRAIATGAGTVHGATFTLADWALGDKPAHGAASDQVMGGEVSPG